MIPNSEKVKLKESIVSKLVEKLMEKLPEDFVGVIRERVETEVNDYLRQKPVNDQTLKLLEKRLKKFQMQQMIRARDRALTQKGEKTLPKKSSLPAFGKYNKQSNETVNNLNRPASPGFGQTASHTTSKKSFYQSGPEGMDEWTYLVRFGQSIYEKEKTLLAQRGKSEKQKLKLFLDDQVREKHSQKIESLREEKNYHDFQEDLARGFKLKEKEDQRNKQLLKLQLRNNQENQLKEYYNSKQRELSREKATDQLIVKKFIEEKQKEEEMAKQRKLIKKQQLQKIFNENQEKKKRDYEELKRERLLDKKTEEEYNRLIEKQEAERKAKLVENEEKAKKYLAHAYEQTVKEKKERDKNQETESDNFYFAQNMEAVKNERVLEEKRQKLRNQMREELEKQINEKKTRRYREAVENLNIDHQMEKDRQEFFQSEKLKQLSKKNAYKENQNYLKVQMKKRTYDIEMADHMSQQELFQNKPELKGISQEERYLERSIYSQRQPDD